MKYSQEIKKTVLALGLNCAMKTFWYYKDFDDSRLQTEFYKLF